jgi:glycosyltransferase involved in cell wall biosynthesis
MSRRIAFLQFANPGAYPPTLHASAILADAGWEVLVLGCQTFGAAGRLEVPSHPNVKTIIWRFVGPGIKQKFQYAAFTVWCLHQCQRHSIDWVYASDVMAAGPALVVSSVLRVRVVYHEHDWPSAGVGGALAKLIFAARGELVARADLVVAPSTGRLRLLSEHVAKPRNSLVVWNCPRREEVSEHEFKRHSPTVVFFHGSISPKNLPKTILAAIALAKNDLEFHFAGYATPGYPGYIDEILREAMRLNIEKKVFYLGVFARRELLNVCPRAMVGYAAMTATGENLNYLTMAGASNKAFDYLARGLALVVPQADDWRELFFITGTAICVKPDCALSIANALDWLVDHPAEALRMRQRGIEMVKSQWNYEFQFAPVVKYMNMTFNDISL